MEALKYGCEHSISRKPESCHGAPKLMVFYFSGRPPDNCNYSNPEETQSDKAKVNFGKFKIDTSEKILASFQITAGIRLRNCQRLPSAGAVTERVRRLHRATDSAR